MAKVTLSFLDRNVDFPFLESFLLFFVTGITELRPVCGKPFLPVRSVRIVASRALTSGHGRVNGLSLDDHVELGVAGETQYLLT